MRLGVRFLPVAVAGAIALVGMSGGAANATTVTSGTGTFTISLSYLEKLADAGVFIVPTGAQSATYDQATQTFTVVYAATGGDADLHTFAGTVDYSGGFTVVNAHNHKQAQLSALQFDVTNDLIDATPAGGSQVAAVDPAGTQIATASGTSQTFSASGLQIDADGATYLDGALGTTAFKAGDQIGSFTTTYTAS